jgi:hypothetical protein
MALDQNLTCLIIEGDSKIIIDLATKILNGRDPRKITPNWHLLGPLHSFQALLKPSLTLTPSHIRQSANKVAEKQANSGVDSMQQIIVHDSRQTKSSPLWLQCKELAQLDGPNLDGAPPLSTLNFFQVRNDEKIRREGKRSRQRRISSVDR